MLPSYPFYLCIFIGVLASTVNPRENLSPRRLFELLKPVPKSCIFKGFLLKGKQEKIPSYKNRKKINEKRYDYEEYHPFEEIADELERLANHRSEFMNVEVLGKTFEQRSIMAAKILGTESQLEGFSNKNPLIVIDCGMHAREWITQATCMYIIKKLTIQRQEKTSRQMLDGFDWTIIPVLNPDGYVYTWQGGNKTMWRKNRSRNILMSNSVSEKRKHKEICIGVDINRNFGTHWGEIAPVKSPCMEMFAGKKPFSEKESQSLAQYLEAEKDRLIGYVSLHTYGQSWNTPFGFRKKPPKDYAEQIRVASKAAKAIEKTNDLKYTVGTAYKTIYPNSGSSTDWVYDQLDVVHSYLIEMIGCKTSHFHLPSENIAHNAKGIYKAFAVMATEIKKYYMGAVKTSSRPS